MIVFDIPVHSMCVFMWPFSWILERLFAYSRSPAPATIFNSPFMAWNVIPFYRFALSCSLARSFAHSLYWFWFDSHARLVVPFDWGELVLHWFISPRTRNHRSYHTVYFSFFLCSSSFFSLLTAFNFDSSEEIGESTISLPFTIYLLVFFWIWNERDQWHQTHLSTLIYRFPPIYHIISH